MSEILPRFVIRDKEDGSLILRALTEYCENMAARVRLGDGMAIKALADASQLMHEMYEAEVARMVEDAVKAETTTALDDDEIRREFFNK